MPPRNPPAQKWETTHIKLVSFVKGTDRDNLAHNNTFTLRFFDVTDFGISLDNFRISAMKKDS